VRHLFFKFRERRGGVTQPAPTLESVSSRDDRRAGALAELRHEIHRLLRLRIAALIPEVGHHPLLASWKSPVRGSARPMPWRARSTEPVMNDPGPATISMNEPQCVKLIERSRGTAIFVLLE
jgi:hypothetical protein